MVNQNFNHKYERMCQTPLSIRNKISGELDNVPCGKCPHCILRLASQWSFRLLQEDKVSKCSYFLTLTYGYHSATVSKNGFLSLSKKSKSSISSFIKRLRTYTDRDPLNRGFGSSAIKYYGVGEYGGMGGRPHYHLIIFNADHELIRDAWSADYAPHCGAAYSGRLKKHQDCIEIKPKKFRASHGHIHYGTVEGASVGYTLKYMMKKGSVPAFKADDRVPEYSLMSKGLGKAYLDCELIAWHRKFVDDRMFVTTQNGVKIGMPKYYKEKLYTEMERKRVALKFTSQMEKELQEAIQKEGAYWWKKFKSDKASFDKMKYDSLQHQTH